MTWHGIVVLIFVVCEIWLIGKVVQAIWRRRRSDPLPPEVHESSHKESNEATALRGVLRRLRSRPDPIHDLLKLREDSK